MADKIKEKMNQLRAEAENAIQRAEAAEARVKEYENQARQRENEAQKNDDEAHQKLASTAPSPTNSPRARVPGG